MKAYKIKCIIAIWLSGFLLSACVYQPSQPWQPNRYQPEKNKPSQYKQKPER